MSQWNQWVETAGGAGVTTLAGVEVSRLGCYAEGCRYQVCSDADELLEELSRRESLLGSLQAGKAGSDEDLRLRRKASDWRTLTEVWLANLYRVSHAMDSLNRRYFDGQEGMFPETAQGLAQMEVHAEELVALFNCRLGTGIEPLASETDETGPRGEVSSARINLADLGNVASRKVTEQCMHMVDMARAAALDAMGEHAAVLAMLERQV